MQSDGYVHSSESCRKISDDGILFVGESLATASAPASDSA